MAVAQPQVDGKSPQRVAQVAQPAHWPWLDLFCQMRQNRFTLSLLCRIRQRGAIAEG